MIPTPPEAGPARQQRPWSEACERNKGPILAVLETTLDPGDTVLEIGSGSGQHAVHFAAALPGVSWLTSDLAANHPGILAWLEEAKCPNLKPPLTLDAAAEHWPVSGPVDAVFSANTAHIMPLDAVRGMFRGAGRVLRDGGLLLLYGPFSFDGEHVGEGNRRFDAALRAREPAMGIRDMTLLDAMAADAGLAPLRRHAMPANNFIVIWQRGC